ncbi:MAG: RNA polymerase sigma factor [Blastocatellales bacterium]
MNVEWQAILGEEVAERELDRELEVIVRQHTRFVYQIAYLLLRNHHDAEDATQETFVRVWRHRNRLPEVRDQRAWLARIAWRVALDRRKKAAEVPLNDAAEAVLKLYAAGESAEKIASDKQMAALLGQLVTSLPDKLRDPMLLSLSQELSHVEISRVLSIPESSVRTRLFRARQMLRQKLSSLLGGPILGGKDARR